jgi:hypothetical protein
MTQTPFDQLAKQYLEEFLAPMGKVERQYEVPGEPKFVDVWFMPDPKATPEADLGLLGRMVEKPCLLEPYRNSPSRTEARVSVMKLLWIQEDERRKAQVDSLSEEALPVLWILAATASQPLLEDAGRIVKTDWLAGMYFAPELFKTGIVVIDELPETEETLWLRILGRDGTQERAIREVLAFPADHPRRNGILRLLASWKVRIDLGEIQDFSGQEALMALSEAFLEWEQRVEARGERSLILRLLNRRVGDLPESVRSRIEGLSIEQLNELGEALLDFTGLADLEAWLEQQ